VRLREKGGTRCRVITTSRNYLTGYIDGAGFHGDRAARKEGTDSSNLASSSKESATNLDVGDLVIGTVIARSGGRIRAA
jgi:hypothetical protein